MRKLTMPSRNLSPIVIAFVVAFVVAAAAVSLAADKDASWKISTPIVTYWAGQFGCLRREVPLMDCRQWPTP